ncbi:unnamed protein product [Paramecium octaurelia]|uniref:Uncharacterized protein n=1 Tax=Paramecium octaurelia TaxID=43137 RepID=A0A8S1S2L5_PAROT|nr:unnamed protein product [Paramecium octaurelia]
MGCVNTKTKNYQSSTSISDLHTITSKNLTSTNKYKFGISKLQNISRSTILKRRNKLFKYSVQGENNINYVFLSDYTSKI